LLLSDRKEQQSNDQGEADDRNSEVADMGEQPHQQ
jgi:hypothetical protein